MPSRMQPFDIFLRVSVRMGQDRMWMSCRSAQGEQRSPQGGRPRVKRHFQRRLVRPLQTQAGKVIKPLHAVSRIRTSAPSRMRGSSGLRGSAAAHRALRFPNGGGVLAVRVEVRRGARSPAARPPAAMASCRRGRLHAVAAVVVSGARGMRVVVERQVDHGVYFAP